MAPIPKEGYFSKMFNEILVRKDEEHFKSDVERIFKLEQVSSFCYSFNLTISKNTKKSKNMDFLYSFKEAKKTSFFNLKNINFFSFVSISEQKNQNQDVMPRICINDNYFYNLKTKKRYFFFNNSIS